MLNSIKNIFSKSLEFIYPDFCRLCKILLFDKKIFCAGCLKNISPVATLSLRITPLQEMKVIAIGDYKDPLRSLLLRKFALDPLASRQIGDLMLELTPIKVLEIDYVVPIPLHWARYASRGFNQAEVIAQQVGKDLGVPILNLLVRSKRTSFQSSLSLIKRHLNVKNAFAYNKKVLAACENSLAGKNLLLIDDLCTTGATLVSAAKLLARFKPQSIIAAVACRLC